MYIVASNTPQTIISLSNFKLPGKFPDPANYTFLSLSDAHMLCYFRNTAFPYLLDTYTLLQQ